MGAAGQIREIDQYEPLLLVDDVFTSGNTLRAMEATLRAAGHKGVIMLATGGYAVDDPREVRNPVTPASLEPSEIAKSMAAWHLCPTEDWLRKAFAE
jgi:hypoxanthine phosphoribosyltransferase